MGKVTLWLESDSDFLKENYQKYGASFCAEKLNRTIGATRRRAKVLKIKADKVKVKYLKENFEQIVNQSKSFSEVLTLLGLRTAGGNFKSIQEYIKKYNLDISHFNPNTGPNSIQALLLLEHNLLKQKPLNEILTQASTYARSSLKRRLYKEGLKEKKCELCGQDEIWKGKKMSLILDHINGVYNDNRLENLRIVCPNCNATLETHCRGAKKIEQMQEKEEVKQITTKANKQKNSIRLDKRKVERPSLETLLKESKELGFSATGRKYGVSDNAIRLWIKLYLKHNTEKKI